MVSICGMNKKYLQFLDFTSHTHIRLSWWTLAVCIATNSSSQLKSTALLRTIRSLAEFRWNCIAQPGRKNAERLGMKWRRTDNLLSKLEEHRYTSATSNFSLTTWMRCLWCTAERGTRNPRRGPGILGCGRPAPYNHLLCCSCHCQGICYKGCTVSIKQIQLHHNLVMILAWNCIG